MPPLDHPVCLGVLWRRVNSSGPDHLRQGGEMGRLELSLLVSGDGKRRAMVADPMLVESRGHGARLYILERDGNWQPRETINHREAITKVSYQRHGDYVHMYVVETAVRDINVVRDDLVVPADFRALTWGALACPAKRVSSDSRPDELYPKPSGNLPTEAPGKIWPHDASRDVAPNGIRANRQRLEGEGRVRARRLQL